jgi:hypothetical protein
MPTGYSPPAGSAGLSEAEVQALIEDALADLDTDIVVTEPGSGIVTPSPNGKKWRTSATDSGGLENEELDVDGSTVLSTVTIAPGGSAPLPPMRSGLYYHCGRLYGGMTIISALPTNNFARASPIYLDAITLTRLGLYVPTAGSGGAIARLALYSDVGGKPGTKLVDGGTVATDTTGFKEVTISYAVPAAGWYWIVAVTTGSTWVHSLSGGPTLMGESLTPTTTLWVYGTLEYNLGGSTLDADLSGEAIESTVNTLMRYYVKT